MDELDRIKAELAALKRENKRLAYTAKYYKEECEAVCDKAEECTNGVIPFLRGKPGDNHPVIMKMDALRRVIDRARHTHIFINSLMRNEP